MRGLDTLTHCTQDDYNNPRCACAPRVNKAIPTRTTSFSKEKGAALGGTRTHGTLLSRQSALPTELPGQLRYAVYGLSCAFLTSGRERLVLTVAVQVKVRGL